MGFGVGFGKEFGNREACRGVARYLGVGVRVRVQYGWVNDLTDHTRWGLKYSLILT